MAKKNDFETRLENGENHGKWGLCKCKWDSARFERMRASNC